MVNIARFCQPDDWMNEHIGLACPGCSNSQFTMSAVHWVPCLKGDDSLPAKLVEMRSKLSRRVAKGNIVVMVQSGDGLNLSTNVVLLSCREEILDCRMIFVSTKDFLCLLLSTSC